MKKIIAILLTILSSYAVAIDSTNKDAIEITSDEMEVREKEGLSIFKGAVKAQQNDVTLKSDTMIVYYNVNKTQKSKIQKVEFLGNVVIITPKERATGDKGWYDVSKGEFNIHNNVILNQDKNVLTGNTFTYNKITRQATLKSGVQRAKAIINLD